MAEKILLTEGDINLAYGLKTHFEYKYEPILCNPIKIELVETEKLYKKLIPRMIELGNAKCRVVEWFPLQVESPIIRLYTNNLNSSCKLSEKGDAPTSWRYIILHEFGHLHCWINNYPIVSVYAHQNNKFNEHYAHEWAMEFMHHENFSQMELDSNIEWIL